MYLAMNGGNVGNANKGHTMFRTPYVEFKLPAPKVSDDHNDYISVSRARFLSNRIVIYKMWKKRLLKYILFSILQ